MHKSGDASNSESRISFNSGRSHQELVSLANSYWEQGNYAAVIPYISEVIDRFGKDLNETQTTKAYSTLAYAYSDKAHKSASQQDYKNAEQDWQTALSLAEKIGDDRLIAGISNNLFGVAMTLRSHDKVIKYGSQLEKLFNSGNIDVGSKTEVLKHLIFAFYIRGQTYLNNQNYSTAKKDFIDSLNLAELNEYYEQVAVCCSWLARTAFREQNYTEVLAFVEKGFKYNNNRVNAWLNLHACLVNLVQNKLQEAQKYYEQAYKIFQQNKNFDSSAEDDLLAVRELLLKQANSSAVAQVDEWLSQLRKTRV